MDLIFTNKNREDVGVLHNYEFDLAFGTDENNFECVVGQNDHHCEFGSFLYIEGTEYGGIVDSIKSKNSTKEVAYSGRTWHGILNSKVLQPESGQAYLTVTGEANSVVASLVALMGLSDLFEVSTENSGLTIKNYKMNRYINGYDGILKMLKTVGGKLLFRVQNDCQVLLSVVPAVDYAKEELDSDLLDLDVTQTKNTVNHLICLGSGELENRLVIHLYADTSGNISQTQTFTGSEEYVAVFDYPNAADEAELIKEGTDRLKELLQQNDISVDVNDVDDPYDIGDLVGASDSVTNLQITVPVAKKIVTIRNGTVTIDIKTETGNISKQSSGGYVGGGGGSGEPGEPGQDGLSAYQIAVINGFEGSEEEWLESLKGDDGKSAFTYAQEGGYTGSEADFTEALGNIGHGGGGNSNITFAEEEPTEADGVDGELRLVHQIETVVTPRLPSGYAELQYIESTGTQYIDTEWNYGNSNYLKTRLVVDSVVTPGGWAVSGVGTKTNLYYGCGNNSSTIYYGNGNSDVSTGVAYTGERSVFDINHKDKTFKVTEKDGTVLVDLSSITVGTPSLAAAPVYLFAYNDSPNGNAVCHTERIYSCQIYQDDVLVRDFVPCRNPDGEVGLYDMVEGKFYPNNGTGAFAAGSEVPAEVEEIPTGSGFFKVDGVWYEIGRAMTVSEIRAICK